MAELSEWPNEMSNPQLADRFHIIHEIGSEWFSYWISLETIKNFILTFVYGFKRTSYTFTGAVIWEFEPAQWEFVQHIVFKPTLATTIKVGSLTEPEYYVAETSEVSLPINRMCNESNQSDRSMNIAINGTGTVIVTSILY